MAYRPRRLEVLETIGAKAVPLLAIIGATHMIWGIWPMIDLWVSSLFLDGNGTFWVENSTRMQWVRETIWAGILVGLFVSLFFALMPERWNLTPNIPRMIWIYCTVLYMIGPGILVNVFLKGMIGRARPVHTENFGGSAEFTPPFELTDQCAANCSFVSGEAAGAATLCLVVWIITHFYRPALWVPLVRYGIIAISVTASVLRIAKGRHFISDVWFAWTLVGLVAIVLALLWTRVLYRGTK
ncbi:MAG: phosphatase PAP2 family protein [Planktomarina sp.]